MARTDLAGEPAVEEGEADAEPALAPPRRAR